MDVLTDDDIEAVPITVFIDPITAFVIADFRGETTAPPRQSATFPTGKIVFTTGGTSHIAGFRAYETFDSDHRLLEQQIVAAWDVDSCLLKGLAVGRRLGAIRTGVLGGVAVNALAPPSATVCAVIGTGQQAETQLLGILALRPLREIRVYGRQRAHRDAFCARLAGKTQAVLIPVETPESAASGSDIVVLATNAAEPVIDPAALEAAAHITTVGPKSRNAHELPLAAVGDRLIVSDSPRQIRAQGQQHMLYGHPRAHDIRHLGDVLAGSNVGGRTPSLYLSAGLAGTEVIALDTAVAYLSTPAIVDQRSGDR